MASRATQIAAQVRRKVIQSLLARHEKTPLRDLPEVEAAFQGIVGDGVFLDPEKRDEVDILASHSASLAVSQIIQTATRKKLSVGQTVELLRAALQKR